MLWVDDVDITGKTVIQRRAMLESIVKPTPGIQLASFVESEGKALFDLTKTKGMEGIVAKRKDSVYRPGKRSSDWLKIKSRPQQEFVVGVFELCHDFTLCLDLPFALGRQRKDQPQLSHCT